MPHPRASHPALLIEPELYQGMAFYDVEMERIRAELEADLQEQRDELEKERQALKFMYVLHPSEWLPTCLAIAQQLLTCENVHPRSHGFAGEWILRMPSGK